MSALQDTEMAPYAPRFAGASRPTMTASRFCSTASSASAASAETTSTASWRRPMIGMTGATGAADTTSSSSCTDAGATAAGR
jgi:hypothetical protein